RAGGAVGRTGPSGGRVRRADGAAERAGPSGYTTLRAGNLVVGGAKMHSTVPQRAIWPLRRSRVHFPHTVTTGAPLQSRPIPRRGAPRGGRVVSRRPRVRQSHPAGHVRATRPGTPGHQAGNARPPGQAHGAHGPGTPRPRGRAHQGHPVGHVRATRPGTPGPRDRARGAADSGGPLQARGVRALVGSVPVLLLQLRGQRRHLLEHARIGRVRGNVGELVRVHRQVVQLVLHGHDAVRGAGGAEPVVVVVDVLVGRGAHAIVGRGVMLGVVVLPISVVHRLPPPRV